MAFVAGGFTGSTWIADSGASTHIGNVDDGLMLSRNKTKMYKEEIEKPKVDEHMKFDYYDVNDKKVQT